MAKLAKCLEVASSGSTQYVLCTGAENAASFKIDRFSELFAPQKFFADVNSHNYGYTSTYHYFTCKAKGFEYQGTPVDLSKYSPDEEAQATTFAEYDLGLHASNGLMSADKEIIYRKLLEVVDPCDLIYLDPEFNGTVPDFLIVRPHVGLIVISVFEENLAQCQQPRGYSGQGKNTIVVANDANSEVREILSPCKILDDYQNQIIESFTELTKAVMNDFRNLNIVKKVLICTGGSCIEAKRLLDTGKKNYIAIYGREFVENDAISRGLFDDLRCRYHNRAFDDAVLAQIKQDLSCAWHSYREGVSLNLTTEQRNLAKSVSKSQQKICGVAGSGKTQVLVTRSINAQQRTGGDQGNSIYF